MNNGIFVLLGFIGLVLVGVSAFFVFIIRRAARLQAQPQIVPNSN
jgi:F0F1-type ATP synthase assembly protein I